MWEHLRPGSLCHLSRRLTSLYCLCMAPRLFDPGPNSLCSSGPSNTSQPSNWVFKLVILEFLFWKFYLVLFWSKIDFCVLSILKIFLFRFYSAISSCWFQNSHAHWSIEPSLCDSITGCLVSLRWGGLFCGVPCTWMTQVVTFSHLLSSGLQKLLFHGLGTFFCPNSLTLHLLWVSVSHGKIFPLRALSNISFSFCFPNSRRVTFRSPCHRWDRPSRSPLYAGL